MLISLYGGHHDEVEVVCAPGRLRSFWYPRDHQAPYPAGAGLPHPGDHGGYSPHGDDEGFSYQGRAGSLKKGPKLGERIMYVFVLCR